MFEHVGEKKLSDFYGDRPSLSENRMGSFCCTPSGAMNPNGPAIPGSINISFPTACCRVWPRSARSVEDLFVMEDWHNLSPHYEKTLMAWYGNFSEGMEQTKKQNTTKSSSVCGITIFCPAPEPFVPGIFSYGRSFSHHNGRSQPSCR